MFSAFSSSPLAKVEEKILISPQNISDSEQKLIQLVEAGDALAAFKFRQAEIMAGNYRYFAEWFDYSLQGAHALSVMQEDIEKVLALSEEKLSASELFFKAHLYQYGISVTADSATADRLYTCSAALLNHQAQKSCADALLTTDTTSPALRYKNFHLAGKYYRDAIRQGNAAALVAILLRMHSITLVDCDIIKFFLNNERNYFTSILKSIKKLATTGDTSALYALGYMHLKGIGVSANTEIALEYFTQAANRGHRAALLHLEPVWMKQIYETASVTEALKMLVLFEHALTKCHGYTSSRLNTAWGWLAQEKRTGNFAIPCLITIPAAQVAEEILNHVWHAVALGQRRLSATLIQFLQINSAALRYLFRCELTVTLLRNALSTKHPLGELFSASDKQQIKQQLTKLEHQVVTVLLMGVARPRTLVNLPPISDQKLFEPQLIKKIYELFKDPPATLATCSSKESHSNNLTPT